MEQRLGSDAPAPKPLALARGIREPLVESDARAADRAPSP
jgi:hypothetical protein